MQTSKYKLPKGMRYSTLENRKEFYQKEFNLKKVENWLKNKPGKTVFAVIIGRHTKIYPKEYEEDASTTILIDEYENLEDVKNQILTFLPESIYYDRNIYDENNRILGQEIAFDIDPENLTCPVHGTLEDKMRRRQGLSVCRIELNMAKKETANLYEELSRRFAQLKIVYSGRGFHIHVFDQESFSWSHKKRKRLAEEMKKKGYLIDEWVTSGDMRLIRLPYSLHGMVSRIVTPLEFRDLKHFDPVKDKRCIPKFVKLG